MNNPERHVYARGTTLYITIKNLQEPLGLVVDLSEPLAPLIDTPNEENLGNLISAFSRSLTQAIADAAIGDPQIAIPLTDHILYECSVLIRNMVNPLQLEEKAT